MFESVVGGKFQTPYRELNLCLLIVVPKSFDL